MSNNLVNRGPYPHKMMTEIHLDGTIRVPVDLGKGDTIIIGNTAPYYNEIEVMQDAQTISDGYHSFKELYNHRLYLTAMFLNIWANQKDRGIISIWKSKLHHDGTMYNDYFIVGVTIRDRFFSYHYSMRHWDMFDFREIPSAPEYSKDVDIPIEELYAWVMHYLNLKEAK